MELFMFNRSVHTLKIQVVVAVLINIYGLRTKLLGLLSLEKKKS